MKKFYFGAMSLFLVLIFCPSCSTGPVYSCDDEINEWVNDNLDEIQSNMTRSKWNQLPEDLKRPTFSALTEKQKQVFWEEKLNEVLDLDWSETERLHIQKLLNAVDAHPEWFKMKRTEQENNSMDLFCYQWCGYAKSELGWNDKVIGAIIASGNNLLNKQGDLKVNAYSRSTLAAVQQEHCTCNQTYDFCFERYSECKDKGTCTHTDTGCGIFTMQNCNGLCELDL